MGDYNAARGEQLGMSFGKATAQLRKAIMFKYVQLAGHDSCFKCGRQIDDIDHLSIEHKIPWQGRDAALFWDLDNIAFSHLACNRPDVVNTERGRLASAASRDKRVRDRLAEGSSWCSGHQAALPINQFTKNQYNKTGVQDLCRECRSKYRSPNKHRDGVAELAESANLES